MADRRSGAAVEKLAQNSHTGHKFSLKTKNSLVVHISRARTPDRTETIGVVKTRGVAVFGKNEKISLTMMMMGSKKQPSSSGLLLDSFFWCDGHTAVCSRKHKHTFTLLARPVSIRAWRRLIPREIRRSLQLMFRIFSRNYRR